MNQKLINPLGFRVYKKKFSNLGHLAIVCSFKKPTSCQKKKSIISRRNSFDWGQVFPLLFFLFTMALLSSTFKMLEHWKREKKH